MQNLFAFTLVHAQEEVVIETPLTNSSSVDVPFLIPQEVISGELPNRTQDVLPSEVLKVEIPTETPKPQLSDSAPDIAPDTTNLNPDTTNSLAAVAEKEQTGRNAPSITSATEPFQQTAVLQKPQYVAKPDVDNTTGAMSFDIPFEIPIPEMIDQKLVPQLSLSYNSSNTAKNTPFAYGWNFDIPSIYRINERGTDKMYQYSTSLMSSKYGIIRYINDGYSVYNADVIPQEIKSKNMNAYPKELEFGYQKDITKETYQLFAKPNNESVKESTIAGDVANDITSSVIVVDTTTENSFSSSNQAKQVFTPAIEVPSTNINPTAPVSQNAMVPIIDNGTQTEIILNSATYIERSSDGYMYYYGYDDSSRQNSATDPYKIYKWALSKIISPKGDRTEYYYIESNGQLYISNIKYGLNTTTDTGAYSIDFTYNMITPFKAYDTGFEVVTDRLLSEVVVKSMITNQVVYKYQLNYSIDSSFSYNLLNSVNKISATNSESLYSFGYTTGGGQFSTTGIPMTTASGGQNANCSIQDSIDGLCRQLLDLNGDGLTDYYTIDNTYGYLTVKWYINNGVEFVYYSNSQISLNNTGGSYNMVFDVNGDNMPDLITHELNGSKNVFINNGEKWQYRYDWIAPPFSLRNFSLRSDVKNFGVTYSDGCWTGEWNCSVFKGFIFDINKDGLNDIFRLKGAQDQELWINNGSGWTLDTSGNFKISFTSYETFSTIMSDNVKYSLVDINGDGYEDFFKQSSENSTSYMAYLYNPSNLQWYYVGAFSPSFNVCGLYSSCPFSMSDLNNDGLIDIFTNSRIYLNKGYDFSLVFDRDPNTGQVNVNNGFSMASVPHNNIAAFSSFSGNGSVDVYTTNNSVQYTSNGKDGFATLNGWNANEAYQQKFIDMNGDTMTDKVTQNAVYLNQATTPGLLNSIKNKYGGVAQVNYKTSTAYTTHQGYTAPIKTVASINFISCAITGSNAFQDTCTENGKVEYAYDGGVFGLDIFGKSYNFSGFRTVKKKTYNQNNQLLDNAVYTYNVNESTYPDYYRNAINKSLQGIEYYGSNGNIIKSSYYSYYVFNQDHITTKQEFKSIRPSYEFNSVSSSSSTIELDNKIYFYNSTKQLAKVCYGTNNHITGDVNACGLKNDVFFYTSPYWGEIFKTETYNSAGFKVKSNEFYYDNLALGLTSAARNLTQTVESVDDSSLKNETYEYNSKGRLTKKIFHGGRSITYAYEPNQLFVTSETDQLGYITTNTWNYGFAKPQTKTLPDGGIISYTYDGLGTPTQTMLAYGVKKRISQVIEYPCQSVCASWLSYRIVSSSNNTSNGENMSEESYQLLDGWGEVVSERINKGIAKGVASYVYSHTVRDVLGRIIKKSIPTSSTTKLSQDYTTTTYDTLSRPVQVENTLGIVTNIYDGMYVTTTKPSGNKKMVRYNTSGGIAAVYEYLTPTSTPFVTSYWYDHNNNIKGITNAAGQSKFFTYNHIGQLTYVTDFKSSNDTTYMSNSIIYYISSGAVFQSKDDVPGTSTWNYVDNLGRSTMLFYQNPALTGSASFENRYSYTYDTCVGGIRKVCSVTSNKNNYKDEYTYGAFGQITTFKRTLLAPKPGAAASAIAYSVSYEYNQRGAVSKIIYPNNSYVRYTYGDFEKVENVYYFSPITNQELLIGTYTYNALGQPVTVATRQGTYTNQYNSNKLNQLSTKTFKRRGDSKSLLSTSFIYDSDGNLVFINDAPQVGDATMKTYQYDGLGRLTQSGYSNNNPSVPNTTDTYTYASTGVLMQKNLTTVNKSPSTTTTVVTNYQYGGTSYESPYAPTQIGDTTLTYDTYGNVIRYNTIGPDKGTEITYNGLRQIETVKDYSGVQKTKASTITVFPDVQVNSPSVPYTFTDEEGSLVNSLAEVDTAGVIEPQSTVPAPVVSAGGGGGGGGGGGSPGPVPVQKVAGTSVVVIDDYCQLIELGTTNSKSLTSNILTLESILVNKLFLSKKYRDGKWDIQTTRAMKRLQSKMRVKQTGVFDITTKKAVSKNLCNKKELKNSTLLKLFSEIKVAFEPKKAYAEVVMKPGTKITGPVSIRQGASRGVYQGTITGPCTIVGAYTTCTTKSLPHAQMTYDDSGQRIQYITPDSIETTIVPEYVVKNNKPTLTITIEGIPLIIIEDSANTYPVVDYQNSPKLLLNQYSQRIEERDYTDYGSERYTRSTTPSSKTDKTYTNHQLDNEIRFQYLGARYYDPELSIFLTMDPATTYVPQDILNPQSFNTYGYAEGNPVMKVDPDGENAVDVSVGIGTGIYGTTVGTIQTVWIIMASPYSKAAAEQYQELTSQTADFYIDAGKGAAYLAQDPQGFTNDLVTLTKADGGAAIGQAIGAGIGAGIVTAGVGRISTAGSVAKVSTTAEVGTYSTYRGFDANTGAVKYTGITSRNPIIRFNEHLKSAGTGKENLRYRVTEANITKNAAKKIEQADINKFGLQKNGGQLLNKINSIGKKIIKKLK